MRRTIPHSGTAPARSPARRRRRAVRSSSTTCVGAKLPNLCLCRGAGHDPRSTKRCRTPRASGASLTMRATGRARYQKTLWAEFKARAVRLLPGCLAGASVKDSCSSSFIGCLRHRRNRGQHYARWSNVCTYGTGSGSPSKLAASSLVFNSICNRIPFGSWK